VRVSSRRRLGLLLLGPAIGFICALVFAPGAAASLTEFTIPTAPSSPSGIASGPDGALWFTESSSEVNKIGRITTAGVITEFGGLTAAVSGISGPVDIAAGQDGRLWFTEFGQNKIGAITTAGVVTEYSTGLTTNAGPDRIVAGPDGRMWFTEYKAGKIGAITTGGTITEYPLTPGDSQPGAVTVGPVMNRP